jgi:DNA-binding response OmpR family regulator
MSLSALKILFVEDHKDLLDNLAEYFSSELYETDFAADGLTALHLLSENTYDVVVLDIMLPGVDGIKILQRIRNDLQSNMPVIMLTALDDIEKKVAGFEAGADDYLCKPFDMKELQLRIHALSKRSSTKNNGVIQAAGIHFNLGTLCVSNNSNKQLILNGYSGSILELLLLAYPNYISFTHISQKLWGEDQVDENTIRTHVYTLRKQLKNTFGKSMIKSIYKKGYQFDPQQD